MGFFSDIKDKIFNRRHDDHLTVADASVKASTAPTQATSTAQPTPVASPAAHQSAQTPTPLQAEGQVAVGQHNPSTAPSAPAAEVDVASVLDAAVSESGQDLNWKTSIVDLMKALGIDSDLASRKELADELGYTGDASDSATMNIWLHKKVLSELAANGGRVPAELLD